MRALQSQRRYILVSPTRGRHSENDMAHCESNSVAIKLPPLWTDQIEIWFAQAEAQFRLRKITTEETKYNYVVSSLTQDVAVRCMDLVSNMPIEDPYSTLKDRLISTFRKPLQRRAALLLDWDGLGDDDASAMADKMLAIAPPLESECFLLREIFLRQLPESTRAHLAAYGEITDLRLLAKIADCHLAQTANTVAGTRITKPARRSSQQRQNNPEWCYYHNRFGAQATKCRSPCAYAATLTGNASAGRR